MQWIVIFIVHIHGKDANVDWEYIKKYGAWFGSQYCKHRFPGLGDCNWREMEGQLNALKYLKECRESR